MTQKSETGGEAEGSLQLGVVAWPFIYPVTTAPPVMRDIPSYSVPMLPGRKEAEDRQSLRCAPYIVRAESLG